MVMWPVWPISLVYTLNLSSNGNSRSFLILAISWFLRMGSQKEKRFLRMALPSWNTNLVAHGRMQSCLSIHLDAQTCKPDVLSFPFLLFLFPWFFLLYWFPSCPFLLCISNDPVDFSFPFHFICCLFLFSPLSSIFWWTKSMNTINIVILNIFSYIFLWLAPYSLNDIFYFIILL